jgi:hypothetical protein
MTTKERITKFSICGTNHNCKENKNLDRKIKQDYKNGIKFSLQNILLSSAEQTTTTGEQKI